jgi:hypothetical protein
MGWKNFTLRRLLTNAPAAAKVGNTLSVGPATVQKEDQWLPCHKLKDCQVLDDWLECDQ